MNSDDKKALVSVIIPVYNVEAYLEKCLQSVQKQSYNKLEIIVVNDGSPDNSEDIILRLAEIDHRIKYIKKENGGLSSARNAGLDAAVGDYISFVDSDDWIHSDFIKELVNAIEKDGSDIAVCNMIYTYSDGSIKKRTPAIDSWETVSGITAIKDLFHGKKYKFHAQNKLYKAALFQGTNIRYPVGRIYEDVFTTYKLFYAADKITYIDKNLYYYLQNRPGSILYTRFNKKRFDILQALDNIQSYLELHRIDVQKEFEHLVVINIISLVNYIYPVYDSFSLDEKNQYRALIQGVSDRYAIKNYIKNNNLSKIEKIRFYLILHHFNLYVKVMKLLKRR